MFMSVDLPDPDAPTMATISPASIVRLMSLRTAMVSSPAGNSRRRSRSSSSAWLTLQPHARHALLLLGPSSRLARAGDHAIAGLQAFQDLGLNVVVDTDLDAPTFGLALGVQDLYGALRGVVACGAQGGRRHQDSLRCLVQDDIHLCGHRDAQRAVRVGHVKEAVVIDGGAGGAAARRTGAAEGRGFRGDGLGRGLDRAQGGVVTL